MEVASEILKENDWWILQVKADWLCKKIGVILAEKEDYRDVYVWLPEQEWGPVAWPPCPSCFQQDVAAHGFQQNHYARQVITTISCPNDTCAAPAARQPVIRINRLPSLGTILPEDTRGAEPLDRNIGAFAGPSKTMTITGNGIGPAMMPTGPTATVTVTAAMTIGPTANVTEMRPMATATTNGPVTATTMRPAMTGLTMRPVATATTTGFAVTVTAMTGPADQRRRSREQGRV